MSRDNTRLKVFIASASLCLFAIGCSSGNGAKPNPTAVLIASSGALDGSNTANGNNTLNIWKVNLDGSNATPLTKIMAVGADSFGEEPSPNQTKILFGSGRALDGSDAANTNDTQNIWLMNSDGSTPTPLTKLTAGGQADNSFPTWSPDGSKIAFYSGRALDGSDAGGVNGTANIWVMNADGSSPTALTKLTAVGADCFFPAWSPDGTKIAFYSGRALNGSDAANTNKTTNIWVMNADGSSATALTKLTANSTETIFPSWSPDGTKIAFFSARALDGSDAANTNTTTNIWVMNADGSSATALTKLTASSADNLFPMWSPDGSKIAFESSAALDGSDNANTTINIWVMNADGSGATPLTKLTDPNALSLGPVQWLPDGSKMVFTSRRALDGSDSGTANGNFNAWLMNADGSGATPLTKLTAAGASSFSQGFVGG